jgi:glycosidase
VNVEKEEKDTNSLLNMVQQVLKIRKNTPAISAGSLTLLNNKWLPNGVLAYSRDLGTEQVLVLINFTNRKKEFSLPGTYNRILSVNKTDVYTNGKICLDTFGGIILKK